MGQILVGLLDCTTGVLNTGATKCPFDPKNFEGVIAVPAGTIFTKAQILDFQNTLIGMIEADDPADRAYPIQKFDGMENISSEATYRDRPYGQRYKNRDGQYGFKFMYTEGGMGLHSKLKSFEGKHDQYDFIFVDRKNRGFMGWTSDGVNFRPFTISMFDALNITFDNGSDGTEYAVSIFLDDADQINRYARLLQMPTGVDVIRDFKGLYDIEPIVYSETMSSLGVATFRFTIGGGTTDLYADYSAILADKDNWTAKNKETGAAITITTGSAAVTAGVGLITLDLDSADSDFPATAGDLIELTLGPTSTLKTEGMVGFAGVTFDVERA